MSIPDWNSLDSVRHAHSELEAAALLFFALLVLFDVLSHLSEDDHRKKGLEKTALCFFAVAVLAEIVAYPYGQRNDTLSAQIISSLDTKAQRAADNASKALSDSTTALSQASDATAAASDAQDVADNAKGLSDKVSRRADELATELSEDEKAEATLRAQVFHVDLKASFRYIGDGFAKSLSTIPTGKAVIWYRSNDQEAFWFAWLLELEFKKHPGWTVSEPLPIPETGGDPYSLHDFPTAPAPIRYGIPMSANWAIRINNCTDKFGDAVLKAFMDANALGGAGGCIPDPTMPEGEILIMVGQRISPMMPMKNPSLPTHGK